MYRLLLKPKTLDAGKNKGDNKMILKENNKIVYSGLTRKLINEGRYEAVIIDIKVHKDCQTQWGFRSFLEVTYDISIGITVQSKKEKLMISESKASRYYQFLREFYTANIPEEADIKDFMGKICTLDIVHQRNEQGQVFDNISNRIFK